MAKVEQLLACLGSWSSLATLKNYVTVIRTKFTGEANRYKILNYALIIQYHRYANESEEDVTIPMTMLILLWWIIFVDEER